MPDDRDTIVTGDRTVLIVEDDVTFARILLDMARDKGFKGIVATRGESALQLAQRYRPDAITLDIALPDMEGWTVLDRLKHDRVTRHIPVHIISADEETAAACASARSRRCRSRSRRNRSTTRSRRSRASWSGRTSRCWWSRTTSSSGSAIVELIGDDDVEITAVGTGEEALQHPARAPLRLHGPRPRPARHERLRVHQPDEERAAASTDVPIVVYTGRELSRKEENELKRMADAIIVKDVRSPDRLLDETALFLHRVEENLPEQKRKMLEQLHESDPVLAGKKALIVDDDMRNIYALTQPAGAPQDEGAVRGERRGRHRHPAATRRTSTSC